MYRGFAKTVSEIDEDMGGQTMLLDIFKGRDKGCSPVAKAFPLVIAGETPGIREGFYVLNGAVALNNRQIVFTEGVQQS